MNSSASGDTYLFEGTAGQQARITLTSDGFRPFLSLFAPTGEVLADNQGLQIPRTGSVFTLPMNGTYRFTVSNTGFSNEAGDYSLLLETFPAGCDYLLTPDRQQYEFAGGAGRVSIVASGNCTWTARSAVEWITVQSGNAGSGNGAVTFTVTPNNTFSARSGAVVIAGRSIVIEQAGLNGACAVTPIALGQTIKGRITAGDCLSRVQPANFNPPFYVDRYSFTGAAGQTLVLTVTANPQPLVTLLDAAGAPLAQNSSAGRPLSDGSFTLPADGAYIIEVNSFADFDYALNLALLPAGCGFTLDTNSQRFNFAGGRGRVGVTTGDGCAWTAVADSPAITINSGASGVGNGTVRFTVGSLGAGYRTGKITIGGQDFFVEQGTRTCVPQPLTPGREEREFLRISDCPSLLRTDAYYHVNRWSFAGTAGQRAAIASRSRDFSPHLTLIDPSGAALAQNGVDNQRTLRLPAGDGYFFLPATGTYTIEVTSVTASAVNSGSINEYFLTVLLQPACGEFAVTPKTLDFLAIGGAAKLNITATAGCDWAVNSNADWLTTAKPAGFGAGETEIVAAANPTATPRTATLLVAGQTVTVTQAGAVANVSAASFGRDGLAAESLASAFGVGLADTIAIANPPATTVAGTTVKVRDSQGATRDALIFAVTPTQINYLVPAGAASGPAAVIITSAGGKVSTGAAQIVPVAPGLFAANADGRGLASGVALRVKPDGTRTFEPLLRYDAAQQRFVAVPIDLGAADEQVYFIGFGAGFRFRSALSAVTARVGGAAAQINYAGAQGELIGLDQLNVLLPRSLAGRGEVEVLLTVDGKAANPVRINVR